VFHALDNYCAVTLSARYFDILKDRLYTHASKSSTRRSAQTVLHRILRSLSVAVAPILSFTAEEVWQSQADLKAAAPSVFLASWDAEKPLDEAGNKALEAWERLFAVREEAAKVLENLRQSKTIGSSLEAEVDLWVEGDGLKAALEDCGEDLRYYFLTARAGVHKAPAPPDAAKSAALEGLWLKASRTPGRKCARCWNYYEALGEDKAHPELCGRCTAVVKDIPGGVA